MRGYIAGHPEAADGLVGIRLWWLPEPLRDVSIEQLHDVLNHLVEHGEMRRTEMLDGTELYASSIQPRWNGVTDVSPPPSPGPSP